MRRVEHIGALDPAAGEVSLPLRLVDVVITTMATFAVAVLLLTGPWVPGFTSALVSFAIIAVGPPVFRGLAWRYPSRRIFDVIASFWLLPSAVVGHSNMGALVDAAGRRMMDSYLAYADLRLFGAHPAQVLGELAGPVFTELAMVSYYSYFVTPLALGVLLYLRAERTRFEEYTLALAFFFSANFIFYALVPAIGPRFYLAGIFGGPLEGLWLTSTLDGMMRETPFARDCFPSGHTGVTLVMLVFAFRYQRRYFWVALPLGLGLISGTLIGRFHYAIDLVSAVPLVLVTCSAAAAVARARPEAQIAVPAGAWLRRLAKT
jgi:hypothetical protein